MPLGISETSVSPTSCKKLIAEHLWRRANKNKADLSCVLSLENSFSIDVIQIKTKPTFEMREELRR